MPKGGHEISLNRKKLLAAIFISYIAIFFYFFRKISEILCGEFSRKRTFKKLPTTTIIFKDWLSKTDALKLRGVIIFVCFFVALFPFKNDSPESKVPGS